MSQELKEWGMKVQAEDPHDLQAVDEIDDWGNVNLQVEDVEIFYQQDDGNSDCGDSCTI